MKIPDNLPLSYIISWDAYPFNDVKNYSSLWLNSIVSTLDSSLINHNTLMAQQIDIGSSYVKFDLSFFGLGVLPSVEGTIYEKLPILRWQQRVLGVVIRIQTDEKFQVQLEWVFESNNSNSSSNEENRAQFLRYSTRLYALTKLPELMQALNEFLQDKDRSFVELLSSEEGGEISLN